MTSIQLLKKIEEEAPLRRTTTPEEVGDTAMFLLSDLSRGITGENIHVDSGYHILDNTRSGGQILPPLLFVRSEILSNE